MGSFYVCKKMHQKLRDHACGIRYLHKEEVRKNYMGVYSWLSSMVRRTMFPRTASGAQPEAGKREQKTSMSLALLRLRRINSLTHIGLSGPI
jgi:hypothetical protein